MESLYMSSKTKKEEFGAKKKKKKGNSNIQEMNGGDGCTKYECT